MKLGKWISEGKGSACPRVVRGARGRFVDALREAGRRRLERRGPLPLVPTRLLRVVRRARGRVAPILRQSRRRRVERRRPVPLVAAGLLCRHRRTEGGRRGMDNAEY